MTISCFRPKDISYFRITGKVLSVDKMETQDSSPENTSLYYLSFLNNIKFFLLNMVPMEEDGGMYLLKINHVTPYN